MKRTPLELAIFNDGRSSSEIAKIAGISRASLCNIAKGKQSARLETSMRIASVLGKDPTEIGLISIKEALGYGN